MAENRIDSKTARTRLKARNAPYWHRLRAGAHVGYRAVDGGEGTWYAKFSRPGAAGAEERFQKSLGQIAEGAGQRAFTVACERALSWFAEIERGVTPHALTVRGACERHVKAVRADGGEVAATETERRFQRYVYGDPIAEVELAKLKKADVEDWRRRLAAMPARVWRRKVEKVAARNRPGRSDSATRTRTPATVNRDIVPLRAALNRAFDDGLVSSDLAWRVALRPTKSVGGRRDIYLDRAERKRLLDKASAEIRPFLRALSLLPLRPGALAALNAADFDARRKTLRVGRDKAGADRRITLPEQTAAFLVEQAKGKLPSAPLFADGAGRHWNKDAWKGPVKEAVVAAGLPQATTAYALRHSVITDLVTGGLPVLTVAQISGTSVAMIEKHYGHLQQEQAAAALAGLALG